MNEFDFQLLKKKLKKELSLEMNIVSDSMSPLINVGDKIKIETIDKIELFDIIVFKEFERITCHYIIQTSPQILTASLKNMHTIDYPIEKDNILGIVINYKMNLYFKLKYLLSRLVS